jgi:hypothetical protein
MNTITLAIILTWACPSGVEQKTQLSFEYPKQLNQAMEQYKAYEAGLDNTTLAINGENCTLVSVKGGHKKLPKKVEAIK